MAARFHFSSRKDRPTTLAGRIVATVFMLAFAGFGVAVGLFAAPAILEDAADQPAVLLFLLIPLVLVAIGLGGIYFTWCGAGKDGDQLKPISDRATPGGRGNGQRFAMGFCGLFALIGVIALYFLFIRPVISILDARDWPAVTCTIEHSDVKRHSDSDGTTYSVDIRYRYTIDGRDYLGEDYDFMGGSSSGYEGKKRIVDQYPVGSTATCYVDPDDPSRAVLHRGWVHTMWFGLIPLAFILFGVGGMVLTVQGARRRGDGPAWLPAPSVDDDETMPAAGGAAALGAADTGSVTLKPSSNPVKNLLGTIGVAVFWNGLVSVFVIIAIKSHLEGDPEWFMTIFMIPFVLVGLGLIGAVGYSTLALFNPRVELTVNRPALPLGETLELSWRLVGQTGRLKDLRIVLRGEEKATYQRGTDTVTDESTFLELPITEVTDRRALLAGEGEGRVTLPTDTMHSFKSEHNEIVWTIQAHGDVPRWPDVKAEFPIVIKPLPAEAVASSRGSGAAADEGESEEASA